MQNDFGNVHQSLDVVHCRRLAEQSGLGRKGRLVARFATIAFDGIKQRGFFTADIRSGAAPDFYVESKRRAKNSLAKKSVRSSRLHRFIQTIGSQRILSPNVDE